MGSLRRNSGQKDWRYKQDSGEDKVMKFLIDTGLRGTGGKNRLPWEQMNDSRNRAYGLGKYAPADPPPVPTQRFAGEQVVTEEPEYVPVPKEEEQYADRMREQGFLL